MKHLQSFILILITIPVFTNSVFCQNIKGKRWLGVGYSMSIANTNPEANSGTLNKVSNINTNIQFTIGKFTNDKTLIGFLPSYSYISSKSSRNYSNQNNSTQESNSSYNHNFGLGIFARKHYKIINEKIYWWLQPSLNYQIGLTDKINSNTDKIFIVKNNISLNFAAGFTFYINKNFVLTTSVNIVNGGYNFSKSTYNFTNTTNGIILPVEKSYSYSSGFTGSFAPNFSLANTIGLNFVF